MCRRRGGPGTRVDSRGGVEDWRVREGGWADEFRPSLILVRRNPSIKSIVPGWPSTVEERGGGEVRGISTLAGTAFALTHNLDVQAAPPGPHGQRPSTTHRSQPGSRRYPRSSVSSTTISPSKDRRQIVRAEPACGRSVAAAPARRPTPPILLRGPVRRATGVVLQPINPKRKTPGSSLAKVSKRQSLAHLNGQDVRRRLRTSAARHPSPPRSHGALGASRPGKEGSRLELLRASKADAYVRRLGDTPLSSLPSFTSAPAFRRRGWDCTRYVGTCTGLQVLHW